IIDQFEDIEVALAEEDIAQASQRFNLSFDPTPEGAYLDAFETRMDEFLTQQGFEESVPGEYDAIMDVASQIAALDDSSIELLDRGVFAQGDERPDPAMVEAVRAVEEAMDM